MTGGEAAMHDLDEDERARFEATIAWLRAAEPEDRHRAMLDFNWGEPLYLIDWIVRQPDCDVATAATAFWTGEPECCLAERGADAGAPNGYSWLNTQICRYIADRTAAGGYSRSRIAFAPDVFTRKKYVDLLAAERALAAPNFRTPAALIRARRGRVVENDAAFYRRYPEAFHHSCCYEDALADTPRSIALMAQVRRIEAATTRSLPAWLRG